MESNETPATPETIPGASSQPPAAETPPGAVTDSPAAATEVKVQAPRKMSFFAALYPGGVKQFLKDLLESLDSPDKATRRMTWIFFTSFLGLFLVLGFSVYRFKTMRPQAVKVLSESEIEAEYQKTLNEFREADDKLKKRTLDLGRFLIPLKEPRTHADFNLSVVCADVEVCEYIQTHTVEAKSEVTSALLGLGREDYLSIGGKQRVRRRLLATMSTWVDREYRGAKIENVFFTELSVN